MPSPTYKLIETVTAGSGGLTYIDFTSIPQTFKHLVLHCSLRGTGSSNTFVQPKLRFNGASVDSSFRNHYLRALTTTVSGSGGTSGGFFGIAVGGASASGYYFGNMTLTIANYSSTTATKAYNSLWASPNSTASGGGVGTEMGNFQSFTAISSIRMIDDNGANFAEHSTFSLYGIKNS